MKPHPLHIPRSCLENGSKCEGQSDVSEVDEDKRGNALEAEGITQVTPVKGLTSCGITNETMEWPVGVYRRHGDEVSQ